jgi:hypothetical protein
MSGIKNVRCYHHPITVTTRLSGVDRRLGDLAGPAVPGVASAGRTGAGDPNGHFFRFVMAKARARRYSDIPIWSQQASSVRRSSLTNQHRQAGTPGRWKIAVGDFETEGQP